MGLFLVDYQKTMNLIRLPNVVYESDINSTGGLRRVESVYIFRNTPELQAARAVGFQHPRREPCLSGCLPMLPHGASA